MEMVSAKGIYYHNKNTELLLATAPEEHPISLQLFGADADIMSEMAKRIEDRPFDILDINMGCPVPKVVNNGEGSALMKQPRLVYEIISKIVKAIQKQRNLKQGKVAIVTGESLNKKELPNIIQKLKGGAIIVEKAGKLNSRTVKELNYLMERKTGEMLFVLEDQRKLLEKLLTANPDFKKKFTSKLELPIFINDELVTFGQTYAKENGYKLDEMGILALYSRIDVMQREDHAVSVAEVKEIMDEAISHSQRVNVKHLARRVFGKGTDDSDRIILKEEDFKI